MSEEKNTANQQIARASGVVMVAFALSQVAGLVRQILATRAFGTGAIMDSFNTANIFPNLLFNLLAGGALASAFVPTFTAFLVKDDHPSAWKLASAIVNLVVLALTTLSFISSLFAPQIARLLAPTTTPDYQLLTAQLLRILLITSTIFGASGLLSGILNAHQRFWLPSLASAIYWVGLIIGLIFFVPSHGNLWAGLGGGTGRMPAFADPVTGPVSACQNGATRPPWDWATLPSGKSCC